MRSVEFHSKAYDEFVNWAMENPKLFQRLTRLIAESMRMPFEGTGKPEPMKHQFSGRWSRRITDEHRLVYEVHEEKIVVISCKAHYNR
ncbi:MAG: Txe/YoeB family addiction module toxin [Bacteroidota bacterium]